MLTESSPRLHRFPDLFRRAAVLRNVAIIGGLPAGRGRSSPLYEHQLLILNRWNSPSAIAIMHKSSRFLDLWRPPSDSRLN
jgi:hypothetical protein